MDEWQFNKENSMSRVDIIVFITIMTFVSVCYGGISIVAVWTIATAPQEMLTSFYFSNGVAAFVGVEGALFCIGLSIGLWKNPDHDAVLGRC